MVSHALLHKDHSDLKKRSLTWNRDVNSLPSPHYYRSPVPLSNHISKNILTQDKLLLLIHSHNLGKYQKNKNLTYPRYTHSLDFQNAETSSEQLWLLASSSRQSTSSGTGRARSGPAANNVLVDVKTVYSAARVTVQLFR